jgi:class 3 adenylate cyclase
MEPRIQYAQTTDGVNIAYWTLGQGLPFVAMPPNEFSHIQLEWRVPQLRAWYEGLSEKRMLVRYDGRGTGLSDRDATDFSVDAHVLDLEAVVDRLGLENFALFGGYELGPVAIAHAAENPERVTHLILWLAYSRGSDQSPRNRAIRELWDTDWNLYTDALAGMFGGQPDEVAAVAGWLRECVTPETAKAIHDASLEFDAASLLPKVTSPTLVFHPRHYPFHELNVSKNLAAQISDARLVLLEGASPFAYAGGNLETVMEVIDELLGEGEEAEAAAPSGLVTILFTDMESSAALRQRLGDARAQELVRTHNSIVREALTAHGGREIKHTGDGIMSSFSTASSALECATAIQRGIAAHVQEHPEAPLGVYIGLNAGEPIAEDKDLFGTSVDLARRICDHAQPGQILVSDVVRQLAAGKSFLFADCGETEMRGFEDPVRLFEVRWREE